MGLLQWLFGGAGGDEVSRSGWLRGSSAYGIDIAGEGSYQDELSTIVDRSEDDNAEDGVDIRVVADVEPEPANRYDSNAVRISISGLTVGYLSRPMAAEYRRHVSHTGALKCQALIVGGFLLRDGSEAKFGVKLDMNWPPERG